MKRFLIWLFILAALGAAGWYGLKLYGPQELSADAFSMVPDDAIYCIETDEPIVTWKQVSTSGAWQHLQQNTYFAQLTSSANSLDSLIRDNDLLFELIGSRSLMVSAHMTGPKAYDFLFLVDLQEASGIKFINDYLTDFKAEGYIVRKEKYGEENLITLRKPQDNSNLYMSFPGSYLVLSYNKKILLASLDTQKGKKSLAGTTFIETTGDLKSNGLLKLFFNYKMLPKFLSCYTDGTNEYARRLSNDLRVTSLSVTVDDEIIRAAGYTYINDSVESYLKSLAVSGKGPAEYLEIAPQRTAFSMGLGFESFAKFFESFEKNLSGDVAEYKTYKENLRQVESYLKISVQENLINWIGDEVALLELQSSGKGLDDEMAVLLKASNIEKARKDLAYIEKMVRRRTPVKFKTVDYHGYSISYLGMKGVFKILLGKFFARYDKPYYTIINNFVIFSNHPQTLESIIDDYLDKKTLARSEEFRAFQKEFEDEGSALIYVNTPVLFGAMKRMADPATRKSMEENKEYIVCFRHAAFQLVPEERRFKTIIAEQFVPPPPSVMLAEMKEQTRDADSTTTDKEAPAEDVIDTPLETEEAGSSDPMKLPYIYVRNLNAKSQTDYYPDSAVHFEVELKNGFKDGAYTEYYESGEVKMSGHFEGDKRSGTWKLHNEEGKVVLKRTYEDGEVKKEKVRD